MADVHTRRLGSDRRKLQALVASSGGYLSIESMQGDPPERYVVHYSCRGIERFEDSRPVFRDTHRVEFYLPANYPGQHPVVKVLTPIVHPHIWPGNNTVCLDPKNFYRVNEYLDLLVVRIGRFIQWDPRLLKPSSPANGEALAWAQANEDRLPIGKKDVSGETLQWKDLASPVRIQWKDRL